MFFIVLHLEMFFIDLKKNFKAKTELVPKLFIGPLGLAKDNVPLKT